MVSLQQLSLLTLTWLPGLTAICHLNLRLCLVDSKAVRSCLVLCSLTSQDDHYYYYYTNVRIIVLPSHSFRGTFAFVMQRLSVVIQRGNALCVAGTAPSPGDLNMDIYFNVFFHVLFVCLFVWFFLCYFQNRISHSKSKILKYLKLLHSSMQTSADHQRSADNG